MLKVNLNNQFLDLSKIFCGVPQRSVLGHLLFLLCINDMPPAVHFDLFLYADDLGLIFQCKDVHTTEHQLNKEFTNLCERLLDSKLCIHILEQNTKCILFDSTQKLKKCGKHSVMHNGIEINWYSKVTYLGYLLDKTLCGKSVALKTIQKI